MARNLSEVIDQMIAVIPNCKKDLIDSLIEVKESAEFSAPEACVNWWTECRYVLINKIGVPHEQWQLQVSNIFNQKL